MRVERGQVCGVQKVEWKGWNDFFSFGSACSELLFLFDSSAFIPS